MTDNKALTKEKNPKTKIPNDVLAAIMSSALTKYNADNEIEVETPLSIKVTSEKAPPPKPQEHTLGVSNLFKSRGKKISCKGR